jgi:exosortase/archaeosortase family protein
MQDNMDNEGRIYQKLILLTALSLIILPFMTTFNETLTTIMESQHIVSLMQGYIAPLIVKVVAVILRVLEIPNTVDGSSLFLTEAWMPIEIYISWNCIGWQSFILLALTFVTGLKGRYTLKSKFITALIGIEGTFIVNIVRILIPSLLAYYSGYIPAIIFHDYFGTILTITWLGVFWNYSFKNLLIDVNPQDSNLKASETFDHISRSSPRALGMDSRRLN